MACVYLYICALQVCHDDDDDDDTGDSEAGSGCSSLRPSGLKSLLQQCDAQATQHSALLPILPCFDPPTAMSLFILEGHSQVATAPANFALRCSND